MDHDELKDIIVEAMKEYDQEKEKQELAQSFSWRIVEYIMIILFGAGMILLLLNLPMIESSNGNYSVIEMHEKMKDEIAQSGELDNDLQNEQKIEYAKFYSNQSGVMAAIVTMIGLTVMMLAEVKYHTRKEIIDKLMVLFGFATLFLTVLSMIYGKSI